MFCELSLVAAILLSATDLRPPAPDRPFHVIVNRSNPTSSATRAEVSAIFMRRIRSWPAGLEIIAVDQRADKQLREQFSQSIHGKGVPFVKRYWQRLIFAGRGIPPVELGSDEEVVAFVGNNTGAIGYVDVRTALDGNVRVIAVTK